MGVSQDELNVKITADISQAKDALGEGSAQFDGYMARVEAASRKFQEGGLGIKEYSRAIETASKNYGVATAETERFSLATVGAKREVIVLGHEFVSGNFSRIPGSLMVLAERMGGLSLATMGVGAAIGVAAYGLYEWFEASEQAERNTRSLNVALQAFNSAFTTDEINAEVEALSRLPNVSKDAAREIVNGYALMGRMGDLSLHDLSQLTIDFAALTGTKLQEAQKMMVQAFENPATAAKKLQEAMHGQLDQAILDNIENLQKHGQITQAQAQLFDVLQEKARGAADGGLSDFDKSINKIYNSMKDLWGEVSKDWSGTSFMGFVSGGLAGKVGDSPKAPSKSAGQLQDEEEVKKAIQAEHDRVAAMNQALQIAQRVTSEEQKRADLVRTVTQLQQQANVAKSSGRDDQYQILMKGAQGYQEQIAKIDQAKAREAERAEREAEREAAQQARTRQADIAGTRQVEAEKYQISAEYVRMAYQNENITLQEETELLVKNLRAKREQEQQSFTQELSLWQRGSQEYNKILHQKELALQRSELQELQIVSAAEKQKKAQYEKGLEGFKSGVKSMQSTFNSNIASMLVGVQSFGQAMQNIAVSFGEMFIEKILEVGEEWLAEQLLMLVSGKSTAAGIIGAHSGEAYSAAYAATAAIPIIGPIIAPGVAAQAAATSFAGGMSIAAFDVGTNYVPSDMVAQIHEGERIIPKADNKALMDAVGGGGGGSGDVHLHVHAVDAQGVKRLLLNNSDAIGQAVQKAVRDRSAAISSIKRK